MGKDGDTIWAIFTRTTNGDLIMGWIIQDDANAEISEACLPLASFARIVNGAGDAVWKIGDVVYRDDKCTGQVHNLRATSSHRATSDGYGYRIITGPFTLEPTK